VSWLGKILLSACAVGWASVPLLAETKLPTLAVAERLVTDVVKHRAGHRTGDLITAEEVAPALAELDKLGFSIKTKEQGVVRLLSQTHPLVKLIRSQHGMALMKKLKGQPLPFDRLERLMRFTAGQHLVEELVKQEDAAAVIELGTPAAAIRLAAQFPQEAACRNLEVRSGLTYTLDEYLSHLRTMHLLAQHNLSRPGE
jgi:hypothetical protein